MFGTQTKMSCLFSRKDLKSALKYAKDAISDNNFMGLRTGMNCVFTCYLFC